MVSSLALLILGVTLAHGSPADVGYEGVFKSSPEPVDWQCWSTVAMPKWLNGSLLLPSLGLFEFKGQQFEGLLDGFGKLHRFEFDGPNSKMCLKAKLLRSGFYNDSLALGKVAPSVLSRETKPPRSCGFDPLCNVQGPNDNVYVNSIQIGDQFLQLTDEPGGLEIDLLSLDIKSKWNWTDGIGHKLHMGVLGSAHPLRRPGPNDDWILIQTDVPVVGQLGGTYVNVMALSDSKPHERQLIASVHSKYTPYFHSYGVTENHVILPFTPMVYNMASSLLGKPMTDAFEAGKPNVTTFQIVPMDGSPVKTIEADNAFTFDHVVNAYENGTTLVFDACTFKDALLWLVDGQTDLEIQRNKTARDALTMRATVVRHTIDLVQGTVTTRDISDSTKMTDFPKVSPSVSGLPYCIYYANEWFHNGNELGSMAIVKQNICTQERQYWYRPGWYPSEAYFIDSSEDALEDGGVLVFSALDGSTNSSSLIMLDGKTMEPIVEQKTPYPIPFTTHLQFFDGIMGHA